MSRLIKSLFLGAAVFSLAPHAIATKVPANNIVVTFSNPVLSGSIPNYPAAGQTSVLNNTGTAVYSISNGASVSSLSWGTFSSGETSQEFSELTFTGSPIPGDPSNQFQLGTLTYTNGTSDIDSVIFGATINLYSGTVSPATFLGSDQIIITTTNNVFGVPGGLTTGDDDYINICGNQSNICNTSIEAVEASEGGTGLTVDLLGTIVGDPMADIDFVNLAPGQNPLTNGFLGTDPPIGGHVPEPGSFGLLLTGGMAGSSWLWRRRRSA
jgi:hypothetical protein